MKLYIIIRCYNEVVLKLPRYIFNDYSEPVNIKKKIFSCNLEIVAVTLLLYCCHENDKCAFSLYILIVRSMVSYNITCKNEDVEYGGRYEV